jgi:hypothetical protein
MRKGRTETGEEEESVLVSWMRILSDISFVIAPVAFAGVARSVGCDEAISWLIQN